jgi:hypothetical protein
MKDNQNEDVQLNSLSSRKRKTNKDINTVR